MQNEAKYPTTENGIMTPIRCELCLAEWRAKFVRPEAQHEAEHSFAGYGALEVGHTSTGLQVWCIRHNCNVLNIDNCGQTLRGTHQRGSVRL